MVPLVPVITASQLSLEVTEQVHTASLFPENLRTITVVPSTPRIKNGGVNNVIDKQRLWFLHSLDSPSTAKPLRQLRNNVKINYF